ncbi:hypothetical protein FHS89_001766 [Rubricella aquisinus]|uniref:DUF6900 domain-containing protein n=1 Tax=Rubricella aquisinus TaxID=2028108 RepID=A0A840X1K3_9RHOB|nr:hypothetical protein [Rubricella aquisinus]MBB5515746.1 hypothetical protein [Rubricella aquisinus]
MTNAAKNTLTNEEKFALEAIAGQHLGLDTLEAQNSDDADFSEQAVWSIEAALRAAFEAGRASATS